MTFRTTSTVGCNTSHGRKLRGDWGRPQNLYWGDGNDVRPQNSARIMYLITWYAVYLYLFAQTIMYCIAFNTGSVWSSHLEWLPEYQNPQKSLGRQGFAPEPNGELTAHPYPLSGGEGHIPLQEPRSLSPLRALRLWPEVRPFGPCPGVPPDLCHCPGHVIPFKFWDPLHIFELMN